MVKKIGGPKGSKVNTTSSVATGKINSVNKVEKTVATGRTTATRGSTRVMTATEREQLFELVREEADKMFTSGSLPEDKRDQVENAVKMAIDAGILEEEG